MMDVLNGVIMAVAFALLLVGISAMIDGFTGGNVSKEEVQKRCRHFYHELDSGNPIDKTKDFLFAYDNLDIDEGFKVTKIESSTEDFIVPTKEELKSKRKYYCPKCGQVEEFPVGAVYMTGVSARVRDELLSESSKDEIAKKKIRDKYYNRV